MNGEERSNPERPGLDATKLKIILLENHCHNYLLIWIPIGPWLKWKVIDLKESVNISCTLCVTHHKKYLLLEYVVSALLWSKSLRAWQRGKKKKEKKRKEILPCDPFKFGVFCSTRESVPLQEEVWPVEREFYYHLLYLPNLHVILRPGKSWLNRDMVWKNCTSIRGFTINAISGCTSLKYEKILNKKILIKLEKSVNYIKNNYILKLYLKNF